MTQVADLRALARGESRGAKVEVAQPPRRWKSRVLLPAALVVAVLLMLAWALRGTIWPATPVRVVPVVVKTAADATSSTTVQAPGWVEADPYPTYVSGLADGVIREILVLEGQRVKAGQVVARLVDEDARIDLDRAEAELRSAEATLAAAETDFRTLIERKRAADATAAKLEGVKVELARHPHNVAVEEAKAKELQEESKRKASLATRGASTEFEALQAKLRAEGEDATLRSLVLYEQELKARVAELEAELVAARESLRLKINETRALEEARAAVAQKAAAKKAAALRLERMEIRSPIDGVVQYRLKQPGDSIMLGGNMDRPAQVMRLYDPKKLQVRVDVPLADAAQVSVGQGAKVVVNVLPDQAFEGTVTRIVNEADIQKNTLQVKVAIANPAEALKPEMLARVRFLATQQGKTEAQQHVFAPESLLKKHGEHVMAMVVEGGRAVEKQVFTGGTRRDGWILIRSGLNAGDQLIASPAGITAGTKVTVAGEADAAAHGAHE